MNTTNVEQASKDIIEKVKQALFASNVQKIDEEMGSNKDPFNNAFYLSKEDQINYVLGELRIAYGEVQGEFEKYKAYRKYSLLVEYESDGQITVNDKILKPNRQPGNEILEDLIKAEIPNTLGALITLHALIERAEGSIKTCRSHIYSSEGVSHGNQ